MLQKSEIPCGRSHMNHSNKVRAHTILTPDPLEEMQKEGNPVRALQQPKRRIF